MNNESKKALLKELRDDMSRAFLWYVGGEDNSWRCEHNLNQFLEVLEEQLSND